MDDTSALLLVAAAALSLYAYGQSTDSGGGIIDAVTNAVDNFVTDPMNALGNTNVAAFLMLIRTGEGTADAAGYRRFFGGAMFGSFADHPRISHTAGGYTSTAAGAYQILASTWDGLGLTDFSPASQDAGAVMLIQRRGALADVIAGRLTAALQKCGKEWASLPGSPYGQPTITAQRAEDVFNHYGGTQTA